MRCTAVVLATAVAILVSSVRVGAQEIQLFNGRDLSGWESFLVEDDARMEDVWSVQDGLLVATGEPQGYLYTTGDYESYTLVVEWRWPGSLGTAVCSCGSRRRRSCCLGPSRPSSGAVMQATCTASRDFP